MDNTNSAPLLQSQLGILLECMASPDSTEYNLTFECPLPLDASFERIEATINEIVRQRPVLRTRIVMDGETPSFVIRPYTKVKVEDVRLPEEQVRNYIADVFDKPFDYLSDAPLYRFAIVTTQACRHLLWGCSHLLADGRIMYELLPQYEFEKAYQTSRLEPEQYSIFQAVSDELEVLASDGYKTAACIQKEKFAGACFRSFAFEIPARRLGSAIISDTRIDASSIDSLCTAAGIKPQNLFMAAVARVLSSYSGYDDVAFTAYRHGRNEKNANTYGMFVVTYPVRLNAAEDRKVRELVHSAYLEKKSAYATAAYPFTHFCRDMKVKPAVSFNFFGKDFDEYMHLHLDGCKYPWNHLSPTRTNEDAVCSIYYHPDTMEYECRVSASSAIYDRTALDGISASIASCAMQMALNPDSTIGEIGLTSHEDAVCIVDMGSGERHKTDYNITFSKAVSLQAGNNPNAIAVTDAWGQWTYSQLEKEAEQTASWLTEKAGVTKGDFVAVLTPRNRQFVAAILGIMKAGAAYVPIDGSYPQERIDFMISDCQAKVLIDCSRLQDFQLSKPHQADLSCPEGWAYMIYTSGSTGQPKGTVIPHMALTNLTAFHRRRWNIRPESRISCHSSFSFDASIEDICPVLTAGGQLFIVPENLRKDPGLLAPWIRENAINGGNYPTQFGLMLAREKDLPLEYICLGGEKLNSNPDVPYKVFNTYGPTEFCVNATYFELEPGKSYSDIPIGIPLDNCCAVIVDRNMNLLPIGAVGELCLAGPQTAMGYWNRDELNSDRFAEISLPGIGTRRVYRTGDLCRWNSDHLLECLGRIDSQVKLRGFRIELGEIEALAAQFEGIAQTVANVADGVLCLYYVPMDGQNPDTGKLETFLSQRLADYMVPQAFVRIGAIPLNASGKTDRKSLPKPSFDDELYVEPDDAKELVVASAFKDILSTDGPIGALSGFYRLGGDSISAIRLSSRLRDAGLEVSVSDIIRQQTVRDIAAKAGLLENDRDLFELATEPVEMAFDCMDEYLAVKELFASHGITFSSAYPLTPMQESMLLRHISEPQTWAYRLVSRHMLNVLPSMDQLRSALDALAREFETLRTCIVYRNVRKPLQAITDRPIALEFEDCTDGHTTPEDIHTRELDRGFDLELDSLMRLVCIRTAGNRCQLLIAMHHIITDGWSTPLYLNALFGHIAQAVQCRAITELEPDSGIFQRHVLSLVMCEKTYALDYWKGLLAGYSQKAAILPDPDRRDGICNDNKIKCELTFETGRALAQVCRANASTLGNAVELAWGLVLQRYTGLDDVVFVKVVSGRDKSGTDNSRSAGPYLNSIPVRVKLQAGTTLAQALALQSGQSAASNPHDWCPLSEIQSCSELGSNLFQSILAFENYPDIDNVLAGSGTSALTATPVAFEEESFNELALTSYSLDGILHLQITFDGSLFTREQMKGLLDAWRHMLETIALEPDRQICDTGILDTDAECGIIALGTGKRLDFDKSQTFVDMFLKQASATPQALAVADCCSSMTYSELDRLSNAFANYLTGVMDVLPGDFVILEMPRRKEFVAAVLGVMKAGAAYVPVDPEYPQERRRFMTSDCRAKAVIDAGFDWNSLDDERPVNLATPDGTAYMIYTSGSTGKPKGAMLSHAGLTNFIHVVIDMEHLSAHDRIAGHRSFSFDAHIEDMYAVLTLGGSFHIMPEDVRKDLNAIRNFLFEHNITGGGYATAMTLLLLRTFNDLPVRFITGGGENMNDVFSDHIEIINVYGPTECTDDTSYFSVPAGVRASSFPIGRPVANTSNYILDRYGHLLPQGVTGELVISGPQVGKGYWDRPEMTAANFRQWRNPASGNIENVYHTGDLARWNSDGQLCFMGRIDDQVKIRGFRIELGEIETAAASVPGIRQAAAAVANDGNMPKLVLYYTEAQGKTITESTLVQSLRQSGLTDYMIPELCIRLHDMPMTPSGKINRKALPAPVFAAQEFIRPEGAVELMLADLTSGILEIGTDQIGATTNLVTLGLNSIGAMRLAVAISRKTAAAIKPTDILKAPTIRQLAAVASASGLLPDRQEITEKKSNPLMKRNSSNPLIKRN